MTSQTAAALLKANLEARGSEPGTSQHSHLINVGPRWYKFDWKANPDWSELGQWLRKWLVEEGVAELDAVEFTNRLQEAREDEAEGL